MSSTIRMPTPVVDGAGGPLDAWTLQTLQAELRDLRFGTVTLVVHEHAVVGIRTDTRRRLTRGGA